MIFPARSSRFVGLVSASSMSLIFVLASWSQAQVDGGLPVSQSGAQTAVTESRDELSKEAILTRRDLVRKQIEEVRLGLLEGRNGSAQQELVELERMDRILGLELGEVRRAEDLENSVDLLSVQSLEMRFGHLPPFSVMEYDEILDELDAATSASLLASQQVEVISGAVEGARDQLAELEARLRLYRDQNAETPEAENDRGNLPELEARSAAEILLQRRLELDNANIVFAIETRRARTLSDWSKDLFGSLVATDADREAILGELARRRVELERELLAAPGRIAAAEERWEASEKKLELASERSPVLVAHANARRLELDAAQIGQEILSAQLERIGDLGELWRLRFRILSGVVAAADLAPARKLLDDHLEELARAQRLGEVQLEERRLFLRLANERLVALPPESSLKRPVGDQAKALAETVLLCEEKLKDIERMVRLSQRLRSEVAAHTGSLKIGERIVVFWDKLSELRQYEIASSDERPITVGKVGTAILLILLGYFIAKTTSRRLEHSIFPRFGVTQGAAAAYQTLVFYTLLVIFVFWALRLVAIPLTIFTVLGGVLAIGIGLGSQNIVNNFISGLIILAERPIKVGDLIDLDGVFGKLERIGPRSSQIRSGDNTHIIVPNSTFLEKNVLNWTMSDDVVRSWVDVGVAYGSPVDRVAELLERAIDREPSILKEPPPEVLFMDFGDNSLAFRAYIWVKVGRPLDLHRSQSRLRFQIDSFFREGGIEIAFPQRDVHLDSRRPIEVHMVSKEASESESP